MDSPLIHLAIFDLELAIEDEFATWYQAEHIPRMLATPGWRRMCRYRCTDGSPFLSLYELDTAAHLPPQLSEAPFRSGPYAARGIRNYSARTWREISSRGSSCWAAPWINAITVDIEPDFADSFSTWYDDIHLPEILACPGWLAARRFECVDGEPRFLAVYDLGDPDTPFSNEDWDSAVGWDEHVGHIRGYYGFRVYELVYNSESG